MAKKKAKKKAAKKVAKKKAKKAAKAVTGVMVSSGGLVTALTGDKSIHDIIRRINEERAVREEKAKKTLKELAAELFIQGVATVEITYNGEGDSGDIDYIAYLDIAGQSLPSARTDSVDEKLKDIAWVFIPSGFENNEGGYGTVRIDLQKNLVQCSHSQRVVETEDSEQEFEF